MYLWFAYVLWIINAYCLAWFFQALFPGRYKRIHKGFLPFILVFIVLIPIYFRGKYSYDVTSFEYQFINYLIIVLTILFLFLMYEGKFWKKALAYGILGAMTCISELITNILVTYVGVPYDMTFNDPTIILYMIFGNVVLVTFMMILIYIWRRCIGEKMNARSAGLLTVLPTSQYVLLFVSAGKIDQFEYMINLGLYIGLILFIFSDIILFYILINQNEKEQLESRLKEREQMQAIEAVHYEELEVKRTELAKFRHDYNNQLTTAILLEEQGNREMAGQIIKQLRESVE